jgi:hypothetical protein
VHLLDRAEIGLPGVAVEAIDDVGARGGGQVHAVELGTEAGLQVVDQRRQPGRVEVDLVDHDHARQAQLAGGGVETPGVELDPGLRVDDDDRGLHRRHRRQGVADEVGRPGRVDEVQLAPLVGGVEQGRAGRVPVGPRLRLEVAHRVGVLDVAQAGDHAAAVQHRLAERGLSRTRVPQQRDVANVLRTETTRCLHSGPPRLVLATGSAFRRDADRAARRRFRSADYAASVRGTKVRSAVFFVRVIFMLALVSRRTV